MTLLVLTLLVLTLLVLTLLVLTLLVLPLLVLTLLVLPLLVLTLLVLTLLAFVLLSFARLIACLLHLSVKLLSEFVQFMLGLAERIRLIANYAFGGALNALSQVADALASLT